MLGDLGYGWVRGWLFVWFCLGMFWCLVGGLLLLFVGCWFAIAGWMGALCLLCWVGLW